MIAALSKAYNETEDEVVIIHKEDFAFILTNFGENKAKSERTWVKQTEKSVVIVGTT